ncbi:replicative DNA helicase [Lysobacter fragariae]
MSHIDSHAQIERLVGLYGESGPDPFKTRRDQRVEQLRVPPQSIEAEQAVLGGLMLAPDAYDRVADQLSDDDFYRRDHRLIYRAIKELAEKKRPYDAVTLGDWFEAQGLASEVAGGTYLIELASTTPSAANIVAYAEIVRDKAVLRQLIDVGTDIVKEGFMPEGRDTNEILVDAQARITRLATAADRDHGGLVLVRSGLTKVFDALQGFYDGSVAPGIPVPWESAREIVLGMADTDLIVLAGRPGMGKSIGGVEIADHVARTEGAAAVFSLEMSRDQLMLRMVSARTGIPLQRLRTQSGVEDHEWELITEAFRELRELPLAIDDTADLSVYQLRHRARRMHAKSKERGGKGLRCVVVDYLQLLSGSGKADKRHDEISEISRELKKLAKELECPVIALSQLNRSLESRTNKRPMLSDLRESGAIEQDADVIVFFYRDDYYNEESNAPGCLEVIVGKQRSGPTGTAYLRHDLPCSRFTRWDGGRPNYKLKAKPRSSDDGFDDEAPKPRRPYRSRSGSSRDRAAGDA